MKSGTSIISSWVERNYPNKQFNIKSAGQGIFYVKIRSIKEPKKLVITGQYRVEEV
jgi:hypothetical protein